MNILHMVPALESGGVETGTVDLAKWLVSLGQKILVVSAGGSLVKDLEESGIPHITLPVDKKLPFTFLLAPRVASIIKAHNIDIVHASSRVPAWVGFLACKLTNTPFVTSCHGYYSKHFFSSVMARGKLVMVISESLKQRMIEGFGVPEEKIRLIYRGVDLSKYTYHSEKYNNEKSPLVVINIGRLSPIKGQREFIKAMKRVTDKMLNVEAWIVGGAQKGKEAYSSGLKDLARELGLEKQIKFLGLRKEVDELLKESDCLVLSTSVPESFGRVIIEAGAAGTACCASNIGGIREIIDDGATGLLFAPKDDFSMAETIIKMLSDINLRKRCAVALRRKVEEQFTLEKMARATLAVYEEAVRN